MDMAEIFWKICSSPILWEPFKDYAPPHTDVGNSETNDQHRNEIHSTKVNSRIMLTFWKTQPSPSPPPPSTSIGSLSIRVCILYNSFWYIFWWARVCWPLLCLCRPCCIFERCLDSNPESCRGKQAHCQLGHPSPYCTVTHATQTKHMHRKNKVYSQWSQQRASIIAQLPTSGSVHCAVANTADGTIAYREKQHSNCKNFSVPLATDTKFVHSDIANNCL